jgi:hypothetical protein
MIKAYITETEESVSIKNKLLPLVNIKTLKEVIKNIKIPMKTELATKSGLIAKLENALNEIQTRIEVLQLEKKIKLPNKSSKIKAIKI